MKSGAVVRSGNEVAANVIVFHERLGVEGGRDSIEAKRWTQAVDETKDKAVELGADGVEAVRQFGFKTFVGAKSAGERLGEEIAERVPFRRKDGPDTNEDD